MTPDAPSPAPSPFAAPSASQMPGRCSLALPALILACLAIVPLAPLVGAVLGLVALGRIRRQPGLQGRGLAIAALAAGVGVFFLLQVPLVGGAVTGYLLQSRRREAAQDLVRQMRRMEQEQALRQRQLQVERRLNELHRRLASERDQAARERLRQTIERARARSAVPARPGTGEDPLQGL